MLDSIINSMEMSMSQLWKTVSDREVWCGAVREVSKSQACDLTTESNNKASGMLLDQTHYSIQRSFHPGSSFHWYLLLISHRCLISSTHKSAGILCYPGSVLDWKMQLLFSLFSLGASHSKCLPPLQGPQPPAGHSERLVP